MNQKILIVEDDTNILNIIKFNLQKEDYEVYTADDGEKGYNLAMEVDPDLILLDIMMPKMDGFEVCKKIRETKETPIIMLTARAEEVDKVLGLELGADDYVTKPFGVKELVARVRANLRRKSSSVSSVSENKDLLKIHDLEIDKTKYTVKRNNAEISITNREFELLVYLIESKGDIISREQLLTDVWGYEYIGDVRTVDVSIKRLRTKLEKDTSDDAIKYILTKRGFGYYFNIEG